ncbi:MAG: alpha/beta hydrolase [Chlamydiales bacterium]|nr:alpha/beta hydrolase [Chlamydiales bacterium]
MKKSAEIRSAVTLESGGLKLFGVLHLPIEALQKKVPAVMFCHGFGGNKSGKLRLAVRLAEELSRAGIASLRIDFRGSGDSEGDFADTTIQTQFEDAKIGLQYLLSLPNIDTDKIAIMGRSLGGALATHLAAITPGVKGVALWCPLFDAAPWVQKQKNGIKNFHFLGQTLSPVCIEQFAAIDTRTPMKKLDAVPMLVVRACKDEVLTSYHDEEYHKARKNCPTTYLELPESNHDCTHVPEQQLLLDTTTAFLRGVL